MTIIAIKCSKESKKKRYQYVKQVIECKLNMEKAIVSQYPNNKQMANYM